MEGRDLWEQEDLASSCCLRSPACHRHSPQGRGGHRLEVTPAPLLLPLVPITGGPWDTWPGLATPFFP